MDLCKNNIEINNSSLNAVREQFKAKWIKFLEEKGVYGWTNIIVLNNAPNRIGKTITTLEFISKLIDIEKEDCEDPLRALYLADRHIQISEVENTLHKLGYESFRHIWGIQSLCNRTHDPYYRFLIDHHLPTEIICRGCSFKKTCEYWSQFEFEYGEIVGAPKEFLSTKYLFKPWEHIVMDEVIDKASKILPICPDIPQPAFERYGLTDDYYSVYAMVKKYVNYLEEIKSNANPISNQTQFINFNPTLKRLTNNLYNEIDLLRDQGSEIALESLKKLVRFLREDSSIIPKDLANLLIFFNGFKGTIKWLEYCSAYEFRTHYYEPYLQKVLNLRYYYHSDVIILNTSLKREIYDSLISNYPNNGSLLSPLEFSYPLINKRSLLLHYNHHGKSCSKGKMFETDEYGNIQYDQEGNPLTKGYGNQIIAMVRSIAEYCKSNNLSVGIISFKGSKTVFNDYCDVFSHFGGHQGSNAFDHIDVLLVIGTYHLNPHALYQKHYIIHNEFLAENPAKWNKHKTINGIRVRLTDNEKLNQVKLYKLNEEHEQAIFRSGAHVVDGKIVIVFGYVPEGIEEKLDYRVINSAQGAKTSITKWRRKLEIE